MPSRAAAQVIGRVVRLQPDMAAVLAAVPDAVIVVGADDGISYVNPAARSEEHTSELQSH